MAEVAENVEAPAADEISTASLESKRKLEDLEPHELEGAPQKKQEISSLVPAEDTSAPSADEVGLDGVQTAEPLPLDGETDGSGIHASEISATVVGEDTETIAAIDVKVDAEQPPLHGEAGGFAADGGCEASEIGNGQDSSTEGVQNVPAEILQHPISCFPQEGSLPSAEHQHSSELPTSSCKIDVPNNKVGVLIGRSGDTIRFLQLNSGAKIQIMRDAEADPYSSTRPVELTGTLENIRKAEQLIKDVIAEADAGGSPALVARGFSSGQSGGELTEIQVPNEKVGLIIGKGGETIKNLQTRSGARIQLIPQHLPEGDVSKERTVRITGNKKQTESAKEMIKEVMNQAPSSRPSHLSGGYPQQTFRPRGPTTTQNPWGPRAAAAPTQPTMGYDHQPRGMCPPQSTQYPSQSYGGYSQQQPPPRSSGFGTGWDQQRPAAHLQTPQAGGSDYYGQGGQAIDTIPSNNMMPTPAPGSMPAPMTYNSYGQSQGPGYGHQTPYLQPTQQNYGHGYNEPKYENQATSQQIYGQQPVSSQPGVYGRQASAPQLGYTQQQAYGKLGYGQDTPQSYAPPRASQPGDPTMYQGPTPSAYVSSGPTQQSYPYGSSAPSQQALPIYGQPYGPASGEADGYAQPGSAGYPQHGGQASNGYGQGGQPAPAYAQPGPQSGGYVQYPSTHPGYGDQAAPNNVNYGYQGGSVDAGYGNSVPTSGYGAPPSGSGQVGYVQPASNPSGYYEQSVPPQAAYGSVPGSAPVGYTKSLSPQPGFAGQYDSAQMYGHH